MASSPENRESFFSRLTSFHPPSVLLDIEAAYMMAKFAHQYDVRKELDNDGNPVRYFEHVRRVAIVLMDEVRIFTPEMVISALLHDVVEDSRYMRPELIEHMFGKDVVTIVKILSKVPKEGYIQRFYDAQDWRPLLIKACDRLDNLRSLGPAPREFRIKQVIETQEKYLPLFDRMTELVPQTLKENAFNIRRNVVNQLAIQALALA
jgi:GTP diphosphokinase / guanosine-3',5'-bis(diphosphate) 3'-diphosphatase